MPVVLPPPPTTPAPTPPRPVVWTIACVFAIGAVAAYTLSTWPKDVPTGTPLFWIRVIGFPALACAILYGLRVLYFDQQTDRRNAERDQWESDCAEATRFAQEPLALVASGYLCSLGSVDIARAIAGGVQPLKSGVPVAGRETVRHTALRLIDDPNLADRYASCFNELLAMIDDALCALPSSVLFEVHLDCPENIEADALRAIWRECWDQAGHRAIEASVLPRGDGIMALDFWLDAYGGANLEKYALFVAVQLYDEPPENSAEVAVASLLAWAPMAERNRSPVEALLHRPVEKSGSTMGEVLRKALLWASAEPCEVADVWQTGLSRADKSALLEVSSELELGASGSDELSGFHDLDLAMGHAGVADAWLAIALAVEHAAQSGQPQAVVTRGHDLRFAVVQPRKAPGTGPALISMDNKTEGNE